MKVGVTGGIGSGKSFVCSILRQKGYPVYDCDSSAKRLMVEDIALVKDLKALIGEEAYTTDGRLNKPKVAAYLFSDDGNAQRLNAAVHPRVRDDFRRWAELQSCPLVFMESAILFESGFDGLVDTTLMVFAPLPVRIRRVMVRDGISEEAALSRVRSQLDDDAKMRLADLVVVNDGERDLELQLNETLDFLNNSQKMANFAGR